ncbi:MAG: hypothetical protein ABSC93_07455 [Bryobacteraceae bacterium]
MIFHDRFELLALRGGDREIALPGREISSGRDVLVHLLSAGYSPENRELLAIIDGLSPEHRRRVLEKGDHEGIPYVVTETLPANVTLREWLSAAKAATPLPRQTKRPSRSGEWQIPPEKEAPTVPASAPPAAQPGEFTRLFQAVKEPAPSGGPPKTPDEEPTATLTLPTLAHEAPAAPAAPAQREPGEFTRMMQAAAPPKAATPVEKPAPAPAEAEPGELTRMLRAAGPPPPPPAVQPPAAPAAQAEPEPGELTRMLRAAGQPASTPAEQPPAAKQPAGEPGELTRMLQASAPPVAMPTAATPLPAQPQTRNPTPAARDSGELTRVFQTEKPAAPRSGSGQFSSPIPPPAAAPPSRTSSPGDFTRMMQSPLAPEPVRSHPPAQPQATPSEFTRMMRADQFADAPPAAMPPAGPPPPSGRSMQPPGEFTRMFSMDPVASEDLVASPAPQMPLPQGGLATGAFSRRAIPPQPQANAGPSEFTQMFSVPATPVKAPAAPAAPAAAPAPAPIAQKSYLPLVLILAGLFLLVVIVIVVFVLAR